MVCDERELRRESQTVIESARMRVILWRTVADFVKQRIVSIRAIEEEEEEEEEEEDC